MLRRRPFLVGTTKGGGGTKCLLRKYRTKLTSLCIVYFILEDKESRGTKSTRLQRCEEEQGGEEETGRI